MDRGDHDEDNSTLNMAVITIIRLRNIANQSTQEQREPKRLGLQWEIVENNKEIIFEAQGEMPQLLIWI